MPALFLFEDPTEPDNLVLHFPADHETHWSVCGRQFTDADLYLPDDDQTITDFCPECVDAWIESRTTNKNGWVIEDA